MALDHFQDAAVDFTILTPVYRHFRSCKDAQTQYKNSNFNSTMSFAFCISSNKMSLLYIFVSGSPFFPQMLLSPCLAGPAPPQKICSKGTEKCCNNSNLTVVYSLKAYDGSIPSSVTLHWINTRVSHLSL